MKKISWKKMMSLAAGMALFAGCASEQPSVPAPEAPPPPRAEVVPPQPVMNTEPDMTFIWTPGYWDWQGRWVWMHGYWGPRPHPGAVWVQGGWVQRGKRYVWMHPHWQ